MSATPGIVVRHGRNCATRDGGRCNCEPGYEPWVYSKRDGKKIRPEHSFPTLAAARSWRTDALKDVKDKRLRATSPKTLREEVDEWMAGARSGSILNRRSQRYKPAVVRNYELSLRLRVLPELGDRKLAEIDLSDLIELKEKLHGDGLSGSVIRNSFVPVQAIYRHARLLGRVPIDPTIDLPLPTAGSRDRAATPAQAVALLEPLAELEAAIWASGFFAGLRRGELRALRVGDVDLDQATITVERGWDDREGPIEPKTQAGKRRVFVLDILRPYLKPLIDGRAADELVFGHSADSAFDPRAVSRKAARAWDAVDKKRADELEKAGGSRDDAPTLVRFTLHECRHSFSTWLDHAGVSPDRGDRLMGHSSGSVARRYRHLLPGQLAEDSKVVDAYLAGVASGKVVQLAAAG